MKELKFKPSNSINPPTLKYDGWFSCGGHCACEDCHECYLTATEDEAIEKPGYHFYDN